MNNPVAANKTKIYTISLYAYNDCMWERCKPTSFFCVVYDQLELAVQAGKEELTRQIERLKEEFTANQDESYDVFVRENVSYSFTVKEQYPQSMLCYFDDKTYSNWLKQLIGKTCPLQITPETDLYQLCSQQSECIEYEFDYTGALMGRIELRGLGYWRMPSDYEEDAGVKFVVGQVVHLKREPEKLYLVAENPGRLRDTKNVFTWENFYALYPLAYALYPLEQSTHFPMDVPENNIEAYAGQEYTYLQQMQIQFLKKYL